MAQQWAELRPEEDACERVAVFGNDRFNVYTGRLSLPLASVSLSFVWQGRDSKDDRHLVAI